jgi:alpha-tubulin suppressor-like RCC1 family protein
LTQPTGQTCSVSNGVGKVAGADVKTVSVLCVTDPTASVGGTVSGMTGGTLTLQNNGGDDLNITSNGPFIFATLLAEGASYHVTVLTNPERHTCSVANGSGTISGGNVTDVAVLCIPVGVSPVRVVAAGEWHTVAIKTDGTLWAWGGNSVGQLGDGTNVQRNLPTQIGSDDDWAIVAAGATHTVAVKTDGTLWTWGWNDQGQLGDGSIDDRWSPTMIGGLDGWSTTVGSIAAGAKHTVGLRADGTLYAWGANGAGQLGDRTTTDRWVPVQVGRDDDWASVGAGEHHTVALKTAGTLWTWGRNHKGQLGDGTRDSRNTPGQVGSDTDWNSVTAGEAHTVALKGGSTVWAWGWNNTGQLGDGTTVDRVSPTEIADYLFASGMAAGSAHTVVIQAASGDHRIWTWGGNPYGQLGDGTNDSRSTPARMGSDTDWSYVAAGRFHTLGVKADGTLWAWGHNGRGQLGDGTTEARNVPTQIGN